MAIIRNMLGLALVFASFVSHAGSNFNETSDAGQLLPSAVALPAGITSVTGSISSTDILDLYGFDIEAGTMNFSFTTGPDWFDSDITVFNANGNPLFVTDNNDFSHTFSAGRYYISISDWNIAATDVAGNIIADDYYGVFNPAGVLGGWVITSSPFRYGPYELKFSVATVPEPSRFAVSLAGLSFLLLVAGVRNRRQRRSETQSPASVEAGK